jgi:hypothetical protein
MAVGMDVPRRLDPAVTRVEVGEAVCVPVTEANGVVLGEPWPAAAGTLLFTAAGTLLFTGAAFPRELLLEIGEALPFWASI